MFDEYTENYTFYHIRGSDYNNIIAVGPSGKIFHFNGYSWYYNRQFTGYISSLKSVAVYNSLVCAVGKTRTIPSKCMILLSVK